MGGDHHTVSVSSSPHTGSPPAWAGTTDQVQRDARADLGSPPHGRGPPGESEAEAKLRGLTPAWAGTTRPCRPDRRCRWAHPRMGGDHRSRPSSRGAASGSPPHGRGPLPHRRVAASVFGLTPAWAGTTMYCARGLRRRRAHPRMGGDHGTPIGYRPPKSGSPPHGRGPRPPPREPDSRSGLTPAWAGTTASGCSAPRSTRAHPRMGGDHRYRSCDASLPRGSPPHGRGPHPLTDSDLRAYGLTPAWAGTTTSETIGPRTIEAHPRMGGDHQTATYSSVVLPGSPPHGRGPPAGDVPVGGVDGLTPAWAGTT